MKETRHARMGPSELQETLSGIGVIRTPEVGYPTCPWCQNPIRRPCQIPWDNDVGILVMCGACYRLLMTLQRMAEHGLISFTSGFPSRNETEGET